MENNKRIFILLLLILIISSCTSEMETVEQITPTLISNTKTPTLIPTNVPSLTPESNSLIQIEKSCMNLETLPEDQSLSGVFIRQYTYPYLENLDENTKYQVPLDGGGTLEYWSISPNGKWFAYLDRMLDKSERII